MLKTFLSIVKISTLSDGSVRLTLDTPELKPDAMTELFGLKKAGEIAAVFQATEQDTEVVEALGLPHSKSPSQQLRQAMFIRWSKSGEGKLEQEELFKDFYVKEMAKLIASYY